MALVFALMLLFSLLFEREVPAHKSHALGYVSKKVARSFKSYVVIVGFMLLRFVSLCWQQMVFLENFKSFS